MDKKIIIERMASIIYRSKTKTMAQCKQVADELYYLVAEELRQHQTKRT